MPTKTAKQPVKQIEIPTDDPVKMVRAIRDKIYEETKHMTREEYQEYERQRVAECHRLMRERKGNTENAEALAWMHK